MGSVYRCHNADAPRIRAAIKVLGAALRESDNAHVRFVREAEILDGLAHPHIVRVRNIRMDEDPPYLEMEYVEGRPLDVVIAEGPTAPDRVLDWLRQLASALDYLHGQGVRHRDVKPANVLLGSDGQLKLVDFGLAMDDALGRITQEGLSFGTVSYAPPEWIDPDHLDPVQWDLYAVGVIAYELLTGRFAFPMSGEGPIRKQLLQVAMAKQGAPPLDPGPDAPPALRALVRRLTEAEAAKRFASAAELLTAAERCDLAAPEPRFSWRLPMVAVFSGLALLIGLLLGLTDVLQVVSEAEPSDVAVVLEPELVPPSTGGIRITGPAGASLRIADEVRPLVDGALSWEGLPEGPLVVMWSAGEGCESCPDCPSTCGHGSLSVDVVAGSDVELAVPAMPTASVSVQVPALREAVGGVFKKHRPLFDLAVKLDGRLMTSPDHWTAKANGVRPGAHELDVVVGECPETARGCAPDGCPEGCRWVRRPLTVPWSSAPVKVDVAVTLP